MSKLESFSYNLLYHYSTLILNIITGIFMVPLYLKYIPIDTYGYWIAITGVISFLSLMDPGFGTVIQQKISESYVKNKSLIGKYIFSGLLLTSVISICILFFIYLFGALIINYVHIDQVVFIKELFFPFLMALLSMIIMLFGYIFNAANIAIFNTKIVTKLNLIVTLLTIALTIILLLNNFKLYSLAITMLIRAIFFSLTNYFSFLKRMKHENINFIYCKSKTLELLNFSSYTFLGRISSTITLQLATMIVAFYLSPKLAVSLKMTQVIPETLKMIFDRPTYALTPILVSTFNSKPLDNFFKKFIILYLKILIALATLYFIFFYTFNEFIIKIWVGDKFAGNVFNFFFLLYLFFSILNQTSNYLIYGFGDLKKSNVILFLQSIVLAILITILTKNYGLVGVGVAYLLSEFFVTFLYAPFRLLKIVGSSKSNIKDFVCHILYALTFILIYIVPFHFINFSHLNFINLFFSIVIGAILYISFLLLFTKDLMFMINIIKKNGFVETLNILKIKLIN